MVVPSWNLLPSFTRFSGREKKGTLFPPEKGTLVLTSAVVLNLGRAILPDIKCVFNKSNGMLLSTA